MVVNGNTMFGNRVVIYKNCPTLSIRIDFLKFLAIFLYGLAEEGDNLAAEDQDFMSKDLKK